jgi:hypothetical protein
MDKEQLRQLMKERTAGELYPQGNYRKFARMLGVDVGQLHRVLNRPGVQPGPKFLKQLVLFCRKEGLDPCRVIFFADSVTQKQQTR